MQLVGQKNIETKHLSQVKATIKDKSVDTIEQNKRFLSASLRKLKKNIFFVDSLTPSPPFPC